MRKGFCGQDCACAEAQASASAQTAAVTVPVGSGEPGYAVNLFGAQKRQFSYDQMNFRNLLCIVFFSLSKNVFHDLRCHGKFMHFFSWLH